MPIRTAKQAFLESPHREPFSKMDGPALDAAVEYALLAFGEELPDGSEDPSKNWAVFSQYVGARRVLQILRSLHLQDEPEKAPRLPTLKPPK